MGRILSGTVNQLGLAGQTLWVTAEGRSFQALATTNISSRIVSVLIDDNGRATVSDANAGRPILTETRRFYQGKGKKKKEEIIPAPPGNWAVVFDFTWIGDSTVQQNQATAFATALLKFIGADVAGAFQYRVAGGLLYTRQAFVNAASALGIEMIEDQLFMVGSLTLDCPFVGTFPVDGDTLTQARDRVARWGGVVLSDTSPDIPSRFMRAMQAATPEAQLLMPIETAALVDYYDTNAASVPMAYLNQSPFTAGEVGHSVVLFNRPRLTRDSIPVAIPNTLYKSLPKTLGLVPYEKKQQKLISPKPIGQITTGAVTGYGGFFNQAHTKFPNPFKYQRVR